MLDRLSRKEAGEPTPPFDPATTAQLQSRFRQLDAALGLADKAAMNMTFFERQFFSVNVALGLQVAERQTAAALKLEEALRASDAAEMWRLVLEAREPLEQLEVELARAEYPPFDRWYHESWIRSARSPNNPHRPYKQLRAFIASGGHGALERPPAR